MTDNTVVQNSAAPTEPHLSDLLNLLKKEIFLDLNCHHLGTIQSFDPGSQTVTATVNYAKTVFQLNQDTGLYDPVLVNYPLLVDMPAIILGGGNAYLTMPITQGDQCLILFNDRSIDNWFQSGQVGSLNSSRAHSFADGLVLVGLNFLTGTGVTKLTNYDTTRATLRNGTTGVGVSSSKVKIFNQTNGALGPNFTAFFQALTTFMSSCAGSATDPVLAAAASAFTTAMTVAVSPSLSGPIVNIEGVLE